MRKTTLLSVFWEGTAHELGTTQVGRFAFACDVLDITKTETQLPSEVTAAKMMFDGCGVTNGCMGVLLMSGLREEAAAVTARVEELIARGHQVKCNVLGQSRGGIACIFLAQAIAQIKQPESCELSMFLFDPVPGPKWDPVNSVWAKDVSSCSSLKNVLAVYPYEDLVLHTPVFCDYPPQCNVEEDVTLGCHVGALMVPSEGRTASNLTFRRILDFMTEHGTSFSKLDQQFRHQPTEMDCLRYSRNAFLAQGSVRDAASRWTIDGTGKNRLIVRQQQGRYLNKYHKYLEQKMKTDIIDDTDDSLMLQAVPQSGWCILM